MQNALVKLVPFLLSSTIFLCRFPKYPKSPDEKLMYIVLKVIPISTLCLFVYSFIKHDKKSPYAKQIFLALVLSALGDIFICLDQG